MQYKNIISDEQSRVKELNRVENEKAEKERKVQKKDQFFNEMNDVLDELTQRTYTFDEEKKMSNLR